MVEETVKQTTARTAHPGIDPSDTAAMLNRGKAMIYHTMRSILIDRKTLAIGAILLLLLAIPLNWHRAAPSEDVAGMQLFGELVILLYLQFIVLYTCLLYGTSLVTAEAEDRTMAYLIVRPISRFEIVGYKYLGYVISIFTLFAIPVILNYLILAPHEGVGGIVDNLGILGYVLAAILMAVMVWGALFMLMASLFKNPIMPGFLYCLFWESLIANLGGNIPKATVTYYMRTVLIDGVSKVRSELIDDTDTIYSDLSAGSAFLLGVLASLALVMFTWVLIREKDFY